MANLTRDLDIFLKSDGIRILTESGAVLTEPSEPLTVDDIEDFSDMNLEELDISHLEDLLAKAEDLIEGLERNEPLDEEVEEPHLWDDRLIDIAFFIERIENRLRKLKG